MDAAIERRFIESFVDPNRRDRWLEKLGGKGRAKQLQRLYHNFDFSASAITKLKLHPNDDLGDILMKRGSPSSCYVISVNPELDGKIVNLSEFAKGWWHPTASVLICVPEKLALFCDEYDPYLMENKR